jgi:hypothetical protein
MRARAVFELAYQMQACRSGSRGSGVRKRGDEKTLTAWTEKETAPYGTLCLMARRLVERGVRFVEIYSGSGSRWDAHSDLNTNHTQNCKSADKPVAGLLADLKARGMLERYARRVGRRIWTYAILSGNGR